MTNFNVDGFDHVSDVDGDVWLEYGVAGQPAFAFINDDGTVEMHLGGLGLDGIRERAEALIAQ